MAEQSGPWRNITTGDGKSYSHINWQQFWAGLSGGLINKYACIVPDSGDPGAVPCFVRPRLPAELGVTLNKGVAFLEGAYYQADAPVDLAIAQNNSGQSRTDIVVLRRNKAGQTVRAQVLQGAPGAPPSPPELTNTSAIKDFPLAEVTVPSGVSSVNESHIVPLAVFLPNSTMQFVVLKNSTASAIEPGRLIEPDPANTRSIRLCRDTTDFIGVSVGRIPAGQWGVVQTNGVGLVRTSGAVVRNRWATLSSENGVADDTTNGEGTTFGRFLRTETGEGYYPMFIFKESVPFTSIAHSSSLDRRRQLRERPKHSLWLDHR